ncbi:Protein farnesyltransferase/geranylgeranyltransferase type-1 subunit alpha [Orchesella cincta]|uniref:Protein farnesyltransferase/geranylgeranyltransferase type-1 subunit alpha n=1 Tax=Orchesella cincta TaxID=48709 RepID=A0A1D2M482_ORCCI|nr:Protein farnesyltransferase/geranylgeranyltransferase type-1 subunit alpha [Orchesella cincta]
MQMSAAEMGFSSKSDGTGDQGESLKGQGFYQDKPEWKDVRPIDSVDGDDGGDPVVSIAYSEKFKDVFSYVWAVISSGELSPRIPHLITEAGLGPDFEKEFELNSQILKNHPKNYQPWQHEKALLSWAMVPRRSGTGPNSGHNSKNPGTDFGTELKLTEQMLGADPKNYHAWQHRQWILGVFKGFFPSLAGEELAFVKTLLETDVRITRHGISAISCFSIYLETFPRKLSPKKSLRLGSLRLQRSGMKVLGVICEVSSIWLTRLPDESLEGAAFYMKITESVPMTAFYVDLIDELLSAGEDAYIKDYGEAISALDNLTSIDPIRAVYWEFVKQKFVVAHAEIASRKVVVFHLD